MKKINRFIFVWFLILECLAGCVRQDYSCFMKVGNEEITKEEYAITAYDHIAGAAREFGTEKGADINADDFWEKKDGGASPMDRIKELADREAVYRKGLQILARERGLVQEVGYDALLMQCEEENKLRAQKKQAGEVIYGPVKLTIRQYDSYRQSQLQQALLEYIAQEEITIADKELMDYYLEIKEREEKKNFRAEICLTIYSEEYKDRQTETKLMTVDTMELGKENLLLDRIVAAVKNKEPGEITEAIEYTGDTQAIIQVISKEYVPFGTYEEEKIYLEAMLREQKAKAHIKDSIEKMEVMRGVGYDRLTYEDIVR